MQPEPTLPIELDSTSTGKCAPLPVGGGVERTPTYAADPAPACCRAESDRGGRFTATRRADPWLSFATREPRDADGWRRCRAMQTAGLG